MGKQEIISIESQEKQIKAYLESGRSLTSLDALKMFGCLRLGARIYDLSRKGMKINKTMIQVSKRKRVALYSL